MNIPQHDSSARHSSHAHAGSDRAARTTDPHPASDAQGAGHGLTGLERLVAAPTTAERLGAGRTTSERLANRGDDHGMPASIVGRGGAAGREGFVQAQAHAAERIGRTTPQRHYDADVIRYVPEHRIGTYADHTYSDGGGRFNEVGQKVIYNTETLAGAHAEASHYQGLDGQRLATTRFVTDRMVDVTDHPGLRPGALMEPHGRDGRDRTAWTRVTGEDPYLHTRALSDGARASGADSLRVPANGRHVNVDVLPENAPDLPGQYRHVEHYGVEVGGAPGAETFAKVSVDRTGAGILPPPDGAAPGQRHGTSPEATARRVESLSENAKTHTRAGGVRYAAAGAAVVSTVRAGLDGRIDAREAGGVAFDTALGAGAAAGTDALAARVGHLRGGAVIDGIVSVGTSTLQDSRAVADGTLSAGDATADVAVDAGVAISSGMAGMAAGAVLGSALPVVGTAAGAVVGFVAGVGVAWGTGAAIEASGVADSARERLGDALESRFEQPLQRAWSGVDRGIGGAKSAIGGAADRVRSWFGG